MKLLLLLMNALMFARLSFAETNIFCIFQEEPLVGLDLIGFRGLATSTGQNPSYLVEIHRQKKEESKIITLVVGPSLVGPAANESLNLNFKMDGVLRTLSINIAKMAMLATTPPLLPKQKTNTKFKQGFVLPPT